MKVVQCGLAIYIFLCSWTGVMAATEGSSKALGEGPVVFKYDSDDQSSRPDDYQVAESCRGKNYCFEKPSDYPEELHQNIMQRLDTKDPVFTLMPSAVVPNGTDLANRYGEDEDDVCSPIYSYEVIYQVREKSNNKWRKVLNAPRVKYEQIVRLVECGSPGKNCVKEKLNSPFRCVQEYATFNVVVLTEDKKDVRLAQVDLPICCSCKLV